MTAHTRTGGGNIHVRQPRTVQALMRRYRATGVLGHGVNFAKGVLIGSAIVLFVWLMFD